MSLSEKALAWFGCYDPNEDRIKDADLIISGYKAMLEVAHLSENKSSACEWARQEIAEYYRKWK